MSRFAELDAATGKVIHELNSSGSFTDADIPAGRIMLDVTDRPEIVLGSTVTFSKAPSTAVVVVAKGDVAVIVMPPPVPVAPPPQPTLADLQTKLNAIAAKVGA